jgi:hypothetical protein
MIVSILLSLLSLWLFWSALQATMIAPGGATGLWFGWLLSVLFLWVWLGAIGRARRDLEAGRRGRARPSGPEGDDSRGAPPVV